MFLKEIHPERQLDALAETLSVVDVDQFHGIELGEFPPASPRPPCG